MIIYPKNKCFCLQIWFFFSTREPKQQNRNLMKKLFDRFGFFYEWILWCFYVVRFVVVARCQQVSIVRKKTLNLNCIGNKIYGGLEIYDWKSTNFTLFPDDSMCVVTGWLLSRFFFIEHTRGRQTIHKQCDNIFIAEKLNEMLFWRWRFLIRSIQLLNHRHDHEKESKNFWDCKKILNEISNVSCS